VTSKRSPAKAKKPAGDWEKAKALYRTGSLSNREIGRQCGMSDVAILKKAKKEGWTKDLAERVKKAVKEKLVRADAAAVSSANARTKPLTDEQVVEAATEGPVQVVRAHRKDLTDGQQTLALLFGQLQDAAANREALEEQAIEEAGKGPGSGQRRASFLKALSLPTHAGVIRDLSNAMKNFQALERIAWNLNEKDDAPPDYEKQLKALAQEPPEA
jgi:hypothetical protein